MLCYFFFFKQKTAYEMRISDWSSDVGSSDLTWPGSSSATARSASPRRSIEPGPLRRRTPEWAAPVPPEGPFSEATGLSMGGSPAFDLLAVNSLFATPAVMPAVLNRYYKKALYSPCQSMFGHVPRITADLRGWNHVFR